MRRISGVRHYLSFRAETEFQTGSISYPFCFMGSSNLNIVASFTTALYACKEVWNTGLKSVWEHFPTGASYSDSVLLVDALVKAELTLSLAVRKRGSSWKASFTSRLKRLNKVSSCSTYFSESCKEQMTKIVVWQKLSELKVHLLALCEAFNCVFISRCMKYSWKLHKKLVSCYFLKAMWLLFNMLNIFRSENI